MVIARQMARKVGILPSDPNIGDSPPDDDPDLDDNHAACDSWFYSPLPDPQKLVKSAEDTKDRSDEDEAILDNEDQTEHQGKPSRMVTFCQLFLNISQRLR